MSDLTTVIIVGLIAIITNLTLGGMIISSVVEWLLALGFKKTQGSVVLSNVRKWGGSLQADIHYTYQVNGQTYTGSKIHPGTVIGGRAAYSIQKRYPVGETVTVHYAPMFPAWAILEVTLSHIVVLLIILIIGNLVAFWVIFPEQFNNAMLQLINWVSKTITG